jgi:cysteine-rich repeat protein
MRLWIVLLLAIVVFINTENMALAQTTIELGCQPQNVQLNARVEVDFVVNTNAQTGCKTGNAQTWYLWDAVTNAHHYYVGPQYVSAGSESVLKVQGINFMGYRVGPCVSGCACSPELFSAIEASIPDPLTITAFRSDGTQILQGSCSPDPFPVCGNGIIEAGEECDDGNRSSGNSCSSNCKKETSRTFTLIIGVDDGAKLRGHLAAQRMYDALKISLRNVANASHGNLEGPLKLTNSSDMYSEVERALNQMNPSPGDNLIFYYIGHGGILEDPLGNHIKDPKGNFVYTIRNGTSDIPTSMIASDIDGTKDFMGLFDSEKWKLVNKTFIFDSCYSGGFEHTLGKLDKSILMSAADASSLAPVSTFPDDNEGIGIFTTEVISLLRSGITLGEIKSIFVTIRDLLYVLHGGTTVPVMDFTVPGQLGLFEFDPQFITSPDIDDDYPAFEAIACSDGLDNDEDGSTDYPNDSGCNSPTDPLEVALKPNSPIISVSIPKNSVDEASHPFNDDVWISNFYYSELDTSLGIGNIIREAVTLDTLTLFDHIYVSSNVPDPARAVVTFRFEEPQIVDQIEIIQHANGVTQIEGFAGNSYADFTSIGSVFGPLGDVTGSNVFTEGESYVFDFDNSIAGTIFQFVIRKTSLSDGYALYRAFPRDSNGIRYLGGRLTECNDGIDNNDDGLTDFPYDTGCTGDADDSELPRFVVTIIKSGSGSGFITVDSGTITWNGNTGTVKVNANTLITLSETHDAISYFAGWSGCDSVNGMLCTVSVTGPKTVNASFNSNPNSNCSFNPAVMNFTSAQQGAIAFGGTYTESGLVATSQSHYSSIGDPIGGSTNKALYFHGTNEYILFNLADGSNFDLLSFDFLTNGFGNVRWLETSAGVHISLPGYTTWTTIPFSGASYSDIQWFKIGTPWYATEVDNVNFRVKTTTPLTIDITGSGAGSILTDTGTLAWNGNSGSTNYDCSAVVILTARPNVGSIFSGWGGACSGTGSCQVTMDSAKNVSATFSLSQHTIIVNMSGTGSGTVGGSGTYGYGTSHNITASASTGSTFTGWAGDCSGSTNPYSVTILDRDITCTAIFSLNQHTLTVNAAGTGSGTVGGGGVYGYGTTYSITAFANAGSTFAGWSGDCSGMASPYYVTMLDRDMTCTAAFNENAFAITASVSGGHGTVSPASQTVNSNGTATITIYADAGYSIASITDNGVSMTLSNPYVISNVTATHSVVVTFALNIYTFSGFFPPIDNSPVMNIAKAGQTIPVKWHITDFGGTPISDPASFISLTSAPINCTNFNGDPGDVIEEYSIGNSGLQYLGNGNWQFNWNTSKNYAISGQQCRVMMLNLKDGSKHSADFKFSK